jgi:competence protein ComEC
MPTRIHFLNVGHGDCTIIEHPSGRRTMIDINNGGTYDDETYSELTTAYPASMFDIENLFSGKPALSLRERLTKAGYNVELTDPVQYYLERWGKQPIFRYIQSHPDLDHMRGLASLRENGIEINNFWDTANDKTITEFGKDGDEEDWNEYQRLRTSKSNPTVLHLKRGDKRPFFNQDPAGVDGGDGLHILAPTPTLCKNANDSDDHNSHSYVLWLNHAGVVAILGGDATEIVWNELHNSYGTNLKCHLLKASHHGRDSGFHSTALSAMQPNYIIVSVGKKPDTDSTFKYKGKCPNVHSTREYGNIVVTISDNGTISVTHQYPKVLPNISLPPNLESIFGNLKNYGL